MVRKNIRVLMFTEDEWINSNELIINKIKHILGENNNKKIYARKCVVKEITPKEKSKFLNLNHIQGNDRSNINLGMFHEDELVSVMTFSKPKIFMKGKNMNREGVYELSRFANNENYRVIASFPKIFKYFKRNYSYKKIYSFADLRLSDGGLYEKNKFYEAEKVIPDYAYIIDKELRHRWGYRKDMIKEKYPEVYDSKKTEYEMMLELGYDRIWDCGTLRYELNND